MEVLDRDRFVQRAIAEGAQYLLAPEETTDPLVNLGKLILPNSTLQSGAALAKPGLIEGAAAVALDGVNDFINTQWTTRTNLVKNPSFETGLEKWSSGTAVGDFANLEALAQSGAWVAPETFGDTKSAKLAVKKGATATDSQWKVTTVEGNAAGAIPVTVGQTYSARMAINMLDAPNKGVRCELRWYRAAGTEISTSVGATYIAPEAGYKELQCTAVAPAEAAFVAVRLILMSATANDIASLYIDAVMLEKAAAPGEYFPKVEHLQSGHAVWSGTAHDSECDMGPFARKGIRTFVFATKFAVDKNWNTPFGVTAASAFMPGIIVNSAKSFNLRIGDGATQTDYVLGTVGAGATSRCVMTYNGTAQTAQLWVNGVAEPLKAGVTQALLATGTTMSIGVALNLFQSGSGLPFAVFTRDMSDREKLEAWEVVGSQIQVNRSFPPSDLSIRVEPPGIGGQSNRWAEDEPDPRNILGDLEFSTEMPGGYKELSGTLARDPRVNYSDLIPYSDIKVMIPGGDSVWEGSLDKGPNETGEQTSITPQALGYQYILEDDKACRVGFINADLTQWGDISSTRRRQLLEANIKQQADVSTGLKDAGADPAAVIMDFANTEKVAGQSSQGEAAFYGGGVDLGVVRYDLRCLPSSKNEEWLDQAVFCSEDTGGALAGGANHESITTLNQQVVSTGPGFKYLLLTCRYKGPAFVGMMSNLRQWGSVKVLGRHGLVEKGTWPEIGFTAKQMLEYLIANFGAPLTIDPEFIDDDEFIVPHAWYGEGASLTDIVNDITKYGLYDWYVYTGKRMELRKPGTYGRYWRSTVEASDLTEVGIDSQRLWRYIVGQYTDPDGSTRTVGPPGSGCNLETAELEVSDPTHPAVLANRTRRDILDLQGVSNPAAAVAVCKRFLEEANLLNRSGSATLAGWVLDSNSIYRPASQVRAGDYISFSNSSDTSYRKIVGTNYSHADRSNDIDIDAPPSGMAALLERLQAGLIELGVS